MLTLHYAPRTRATRVRWMLEELGVPYHLRRVDVAGGEHKRPEYLATVHPLGHLPSLTDGDRTLFESAAQVLYLADKFPAAQLAPPPGTPERGQFYQWVFFATTEMEPHCWAHWLHTRVLPEDRRIAGLAERARATLNHNLVAIEDHLADGREYLLGSFTAADVVAGWVATWAFGQKMVDDRPHLAAWSRRLAERPANQRARAD